jgi:hypothetical protein
VCRMSCRAVCRNRYDENYENEASPFCKKDATRPLNLVIPFRDGFLLLRSEY